MKTWENVPDGTYYVTKAGEWLPVTPEDGYFIGLRENTRGGREAPFMGVWTAEDGEKFIDPSRWEAKLEPAVKLGMIHEQIAIWDCKNKQEIFL